MKKNVIFNTIIGKIAVESEVEFSVSEDLLNGVEDAWEEGVAARMSILRPDHIYCSEEMKSYVMYFTCAVVEDIEILRKQNEMYAKKEDNGRHNVDLHSLEIRELRIDGRYLRIEWTFIDCFGDKRCFCGNQYYIHKGCKYGDDVYCVGGSTSLRVYF